VLTASEIQTLIDKHNVTKQQITDQLSAMRKLGKKKAEEDCAHSTKKPLSRAAAKQAINAAEAVLESATSKTKKQAAKDALDQAKQACTAAEEKNIWKRKDREENGLSEKTVQVCRSRERKKAREEAAAAAGALRATQTSGKESKGATASH
jgi:hypothetical protein